MTTELQPGTTSYETPNETEVVITRVVDASRDLAFDAWTNPLHLPHWMTGPEGWTMPVCEIDLRAGGRWRFGWRKTGGEELVMEGTYRAVDRPERVVFTERWGPAWPETLNTLVFTERGDHTVITLTIAYPSKPARDAALATGMKDGSDRSYARLDALLRTLQS